jgi:hypothetical protein
LETAELPSGINNDVPAPQSTLQPRNQDFHPNAWVPREGSLSPSLSGLTARTVKGRAFTGQRGQVWPPDPPPIGQGLTRKGDPWQSDRWPGEENQVAFILLKGLTGVRREADSGQLWGGWRPTTWPTAPGTVLKISPQKSDHFLLIALLGLRRGGFPHPAKDSGPKPRM